MFVFKLKYVYDVLYVTNENMTLFLQLFVQKAFCHSFKEHCSF